MTQAAPVRELIAYRELLWMLVWRDLRVRYKHAALGAAWAVIPPLMTTLVFAMVFRHALGVRNEALTGYARVPYPLFALAGLLSWTYFANSLTGAVTSLVANRPVLTKVQFPREVFPLAAVGSALLDFALAAGAFITLSFWYHAATDWRFEPSWALAFLPAVVLVQTILGAGLALLLAMGHLYYRDIGFLLRGILPLGLFVTNVVYEWHGAGPRWQFVLNLNPLTPIITAYRDCLFAQRLPNPATFGYSTAVAILTLAAAWAWFHRREFEFAENA